MRASAHVAPSQSAGIIHLIELTSMSMSCSALIVQQAAVQQMMLEDPALAQELMIAVVSKQSAKQ